MIAVIRRFMGKPACIEAFADLILSLLARAGKFKTDGLRERSVVEGRSEGPLGGCRIPVCSLSANSEVRSRDLRWPLHVNSVEKPLNWPLAEKWPRFAFALL
jgi:hypothetical protein